MYGVEENLGIARQPATSSVLFMTITNPFIVIEISSSWKPAHRASLTKLATEHTPLNGRSYPRPVRAVGE